MDFSTGFYFINMENDYEYQHENALYLINPKGTLRKLFIPIRAQCIKESIGIPINTWIYIDAVYANKIFKIGFLINGSIHPYNHFQIFISF